MSNNLKLHIGSILIVFLALTIWKIAYGTNCFIVIIPIFVLVVISLSFIELKVYDRLCFRDCYFNQKSLISSLLTSKILIIVLYLLLSILMTVSVMYSVIDYGIELWGYLFFHIILVIYIYKKITKLFNGTVKMKYLYMFSREWTINVSSLFFFIVYAYIAINGYVPTYLSDDLSKTITLASNEIASNCVIIDYVLRIKIELDSVFWWVTSQTSDKADGVNLKEIIWTVFILINALAVFGVNRFIVQIVYFVEKIFPMENDACE